MEKPDIKALFFDVDGTLINYHDHTIHPDDLAALKKLHELGYKLFIATGRDVTVPAESKSIEPFVNVFDGFVNSNGQQCFLTDGTMITEHPLNVDDFIAIRDVCEERHYALYYTLNNETYITEATDLVKEFNAVVGIRVPDVRPIEPDRTHIIKACVYITPEDELKYLEPVMKHTFVTHSKGPLVDLIPEGVGKDTGIREVCDYLGITIEQTMAFGDGENDIAMLKTAGIGVAMGIAAEEVRAAADYVTLKPEEGGIAAALRHYGLI